MNQFLSNKIIFGIVALALLVGVGVLISSRDTSPTTRNAALVVATTTTTTTPTVAATTTIVAAAITATSTTIALTCATGGTCAVGDRGPGGGIVFYSQGSFACGPGRASKCKYMEAAPENWLTGTVGDPQRKWSTMMSIAFTASPIPTTIVPVLAPQFIQWVVGSGYQNSLDMVAQAGSVAHWSAAVLARSYQGGSKTDWYLPSKDELNNMCKWQTGKPWISDWHPCGGGTLNSGPGARGFASGGHWSSSEWGSNHGWHLHFPTNGTHFQPACKCFNQYVRPVRAF